jgi:hypothetical protein
MQNGVLDGVEDGCETAGPEDGGVQDSVQLVAQADPKAPGWSKSFDSQESQPCSKALE